MRLEIRHQMFGIWLVGAMAGVAGSAAAQILAGPETQKTVLPTQLQYTSAIQAYQAYKDQPVRSWREANDHVGKIGGWRTYAKEAQTDKTTEPGQNAPSKDPHAGHHGGGQP